MNSAHPELYYHAMETDLEEAGMDLLGKIDNVFAEVKWNRSQIWAWLASDEVLPTLKQWYKHDYSGIDISSTPRPVFNDSVWGLCLDVFKEDSTKSQVFLAAVRNSTSGAILEDGISPLDATAVRVYRITADCSHRGGSLASVQGPTCFKIITNLIWIISEELKENQRDGVFGMLFEKEDGDPVYGVDKRRVRSEEATSTPHFTELESALDRSRPESADENQMSGHQYGSFRDDANAVQSATSSGNPGHGLRRDRQSVVSVGVRQEQGSAERRQQQLSPSASHAGALAQRSNSPNINDTKSQRTVRRLRRSAKKRKAYIIEDSDDDEETDPGAAMESANLPNTRHGNANNSQAQAGSPSVNVTSHLPTGNVPSNASQQPINNNHNAFASQTPIASNLNLTANQELEILRAQLHLANTQLWHANHAIHQKDAELAGLRGALAGSMVETQKQKASKDKYKDQLQKLQRHLGELSKVDIEAKK
ncbi:hypothetical protein K402DRAFT_393405 [Aulographum hederae CBS 113979]|uniref:Uncharacterized protein n=1 Tax=Aulographum hederae CBS 113979 TaxID=1176131 RepID=A0A6G1H0P9_9PEZI|nr:hypothetical protein K402DRAFT_393405 [Aulographum hederae CBS 113979]